MGPHRVRWSAALLTADMSDPRCSLHRWPGLQCADIVVDDGRVSIDCLSPRRKNFAFYAIRA